MTRRGWQFMQDGVLFATYIDSTGRRGKQQFRAQNWWMGMGTRPLGRGTLTVTGMFSLEPATLTSQGYSEIFQVGETYKDRPLVDHQHPHDFLMQLAFLWRVPFANGRAGFTIAGAPVGEAGVGPVAFMHRQSAAENPIAPLSHHTFDSSHITHGVIAAAVDAGPVVLEGAVFHGREPDENRWDLMDPGPLDSWSSRLWWRPGLGLELQASYAHVKNPERLAPQNVNKTIVSASWLRQSGAGYTAATAAFGRNDRDFSRSDAFLFEGTHRFSGNVIYTRYEWVEVEAEHLAFVGFLHKPHFGERIESLKAVTVGGLREIAKIGGFELGIGADLQLYDVPFLLRRPYYNFDDPALLDGKRPRTFHVFLRIRPPVSSMGRMFNMTMTRPMRGHGM